jgi:hypothetical protein
VSFLNAESAAGALTYFLTGLLVLPFMYGRVITHIKESLVRSIFTKAVFAACTLICLLFGYWRGLDAWLVLPGLVWLAAAYLEAERIVLQWRHRGAPPVERDEPAFSLFRPFTTTALAMRRYELKVPHWKAGRLRVVHISDVHAHNTLHIDYFHGVMDRIRQLNPDIVFITGDFVSRVKHVRLLRDVFKGLSAQKGVYACLGNHDWWAGADEVRAALAGTEIRILDSKGRTIDAGGGDSVLVSGCEDPWGESAWVPPMAADGVPMLVLAHTADNIYRLSRAGAFAVFSGHYHAGQAVVPWYGSIIIPSKYGRRFDHGHFVVGRTHLYVTAGVGTAYPPFRIYCHPEILVVDLVAGA